MCTPRLEWHRPIAAAAAHSVEWSRPHGVRSVPSAPDDAAARAGGAAPVGLGLPAGCWADGAALDRGVLDDGVARKVEVLVTCESDDGGVEDCALLAASAAIASLENTPLVLHAAPLTCAVTEDGAVLADPSIDEASGCARVTVVVGVDRVNGVSSDAPLLKVSVNGAMPAAALERCITLASKRAATIRWPHAMAD